MAETGDGAHEVQVRNQVVADMDKAVAFHRDVLGLKPGIQNPEWSEFDTGETRLALHPASPGYPAGRVELTFGSEDLDGFYAAREELGIRCIMSPTDLPGRRIARFLDSEGVEMSVGG